MNPLLPWLRAPAILTAVGSPLRVDGGTARVHVVVQGHGWLRCEGQTLLVTGSADVTFPADGRARSVLVMFRGLRGTVRAHVDIPAGHALATAIAPVVAITVPTVDAAALRPVSSAALRPRPGGSSVLLRAEHLSSPAPSLDRSRLTPPRSAPDRRT